MAALQWFWDAIAPNLIASAIAFTCGVLWARRRVLPHVLRLHSSLADLHDKVDGLGSS